MTIVNPLDLDSLVLKHGSHHSPEDGMCAMEAAAYMAGEPFTDHPACVSPVIAAFMRAWNDGLPDDASRTRLLAPLVPLTLGTATTAADEETRAWLATDWLVRVQAPAWLRLAGLTDQADLLAGMVALTPATTPSLLGPIKAVRTDAAAAWAAAGDAAWDAARAAAGDAAWDAARDAAWDAARDAAGDAAWDAARAAARDAAGDAARDAARAAARDAAGDAAWDAARDAAWDAARDAARDALTPTTTALQESAAELVKAMCRIGRAA